MGYKDQLVAQFDEITEGIEAILERAAGENRDLTADENAQIERDDARRGELQKSIEHYTGIEARTSKVDALRAQMPAARRGGGRVVEPEPEFDLLREFPTPGHYAATVHRALVKKDRDAIALLERATAHQMVADNLGLVPKAIAGPVIDRMRLMRPLVQSVTTRTPPGPKFDRPIVTQQVDVGAQVIEKDLTTSRKMLVGTVEITLQTHAGHLNISKQDIRWSQPGILDLVFQSFAKMYARVSDSAACSAFTTKVTQTQEIAGAPGTYTAAAIDAALGTAGSTIAGASGDNGELNHAWVSRDVGIALASLRNANTGQKLYNIPLINGTTGDLDGIPVTVDPRFAAATFIVGDESLVEFWEDLEGFMSIDEPDVLGQLVGYAGYNQLGVVDPTGFVKLTNIAALSADTVAKK
jgi:HK97 family phage major capsid protein